MFSIAKAFLVGNLVADPERKETKDGKEIASFTVAVNRYSSKSEEGDASFIDVVSFGKPAEFANKYFTKGKLVYIDGYIRQNRWTNSEGQKRSKIEVVAEKLQFISTGKRDNQESHGEPGNQGDHGPEGDVPF